MSKIIGKEDKGKLKENNRNLKGNEIFISFVSTPKLFRVVNQQTQK
jgi:hypothetical protein